MKIILIVTLILSTNLATAQTLSSAVTVPSISNNEEVQDFYRITFWQPEFNHFIREIIRKNPYTADFTCQKVKSFNCYAYLNSYGSFVRPDDSFIDNQVGLIGGKSNTAHTLMKSVEENNYQINFGESLSGTLTRFDKFVGLKEINCKMVQTYGRSGENRPTPSCQLMINQLGQLISPL